MKDIEIFMDIGFLGNYAFEIHLVWTHICNGRKLETHKVLVHVFFMNLTTVKFAIYLHIHPLCSIGGALLWKIYVKDRQFFWVW